MTTLQAPDGTRYETDNDAEVRELTIGHGYQVIEDGPQPDAPQPQTTQPPQSVSAPAPSTPDTNPDAPTF